MLIDDKRVGAVTWRNRVDYVGCKNKKRKRWNNLHATHNQEVQASSNQRVALILLSLFFSLYCSSRMSNGMHAAMHVQMMINFERILMQEQYRKYRYVYITR